MLYFGCSRPISNKHDGIPVPILAKVDGELQERMARNFHRLETGRYLPDSIYEIPSRNYHEASWPGDLPGRLILGQTLLQQASGREAKYLEVIMDDLPNHFNDKGYMGIIYDDVLNEQQLSGHGWLLRGLSEYYLMTGDDTVLDYIKTISDNLILPTAGYHQDYPLDPSIRDEAGGYMGTNQKELDGWILSSDVGCNFIFMDGVIQVYTILQTPELKSISYEMADRFLEADLYNIKAQTHATLTALRGLMRLYAFTGEKRFLEGAIERYNLYKAEGMTENYENFNWFQRPEWTEPCAVVDSYQLALELWKHTGEGNYLNDAQLIWYNGISYAQRDNGGFGLSNCPGPTEQSLEAILYEAHWCCTMRGSEGIAERIGSLYFSHGASMIIADFHNSEVTFDLPSGEITLLQQSSYPLEGHVQLYVKESSLKKATPLKIFIPEWIEKIQLTKNGKDIPIVKEGYYLILNDRYQTGDQYSLTFDQHLGKIMPHNNNTLDNYFKMQYGPLVLGVENQEDEIVLPKDFQLQRIGLNAFSIIGSPWVLHPINHLMDEKVNPGNNHSSQILFTSTQ